MGVWTGGVWRTVITSKYLKGMFASIDFSVLKGSTIQATCWSEGCLWQAVLFVLVSNKVAAACSGCLFIYEIVNDASKLTGEYSVE